MASFSIDQSVPKFAVRVIGRSRRYLSVCISIRGRTSNPIIPGFPECADVIFRKVARDWTRDMTTVAPYVPYVCKGMDGSSYDGTTR